MVAKKKTVKKQVVKKVEKKRTATAAEGRGWGNKKKDKDEPDRRQKLLAKTMDEKVKKPAMIVTSETVGPAKEEAFLPATDDKPNTLSLIKNSEQFMELRNVAGNTISTIGKFLTTIPKNAKDIPLEMVGKAVNFSRGISALGKISEELRKSVSQPLYEANKAVNALFHDVMDDVEARDKSLRSVLTEVAQELKSTTKFPGIGTLEIKPVNKPVILDIDSVPDEYKMTVINESAVDAAIAAGVEEIPGMIIDTVYTIKVSGEKADDK